MVFRVRSILCSSLLQIRYKQSFCILKNSILIIGSIYRQPDDSQHGHPSKASDFSKLLDSLQKILTDITTKQNSPTIIIRGDFNLPHMYDKKVPSKEEQLMIKLLNTYCLEQSLSQVIQSSTHKNGNILNLLLTNDTQHIHSHAVIPTSNKISDHYILHVGTRLFLESKPNSSDQPKNWESYAKHNFFQKNIKWEVINEKLSNINWENEFDGKSVDEMLEAFYEITYQIVSINILLKSLSEKMLSKTERECRNLTRRRCRINKYLLRITSPQRIKKFHSELILIEQKL